MQVIVNAEIEFPIFDKVGIRGVVFFDVGNAFNLEDQYCKTQAVQRRRQQEPLQRRRSTSHAYRASWGFGFRWFSPIGPAALRVGHPVQDRCPASSPIVFEFTIGNFF